MFLIMLPTTRYIVPLMMNGCAAPSQNEFLLRPHEHHAFTSSPERFIIVIKVLFPDVLPRNSPLASLPGTFDGHCKWVGFPFLSRWTSPAWIINSDRLCSRNKLLHLSMKMIEQKDDKHSGVHLSKLFTWGPNPSCWIHLKNGFVALTIHHWHVAFTEKQICHTVLLIDSTCQLLAVSRISCWLDLPNWWNSLRVRFEAAAWRGSAAEQSSKMFWMQPSRQVMNVDLDTDGCGGTPEVRE